MKGLLGWIETQNFTCKKVITLTGLLLNFCCIRSAGRTDEDCYLSITGKQIFSLNMSKKEDA